MNGRAIVAVLVGAVVAVGACKREPATPEDRFWTWFGGSADRIRAAPDQLASSNELNDQLGRLGFSVAGELESNDDGPWRLVITADGDRAVFPEVARLTAKAPLIPGWTVVAFRQRMPIAGLVLEMDGRKLAFDDVRFVATRAGDELDLQVFLPPPIDDVVEQLGFIALDHAVGERDMATRIGAIDWVDAAGAPATARPIAELPVALDETFGPGRS